ncbi:hypothetical protein HD554DRAFT_2026564 [Boletus coccyginus]|nr:hypothetical protein HD554DRAFT_2026564 [Boletus coccyginus]
MSTVEEFTVGADDGYYNQGIFSSIALILTHPSIDDEPDNGHQVDDIRVEYHPHSGRAPKISPFGEFTREHLHVPLAPEDDREPWHPFRTLMDFEVSELALEAALNKDQTTRLIKLLQRVYDKHERCTLRNYDELRNTWDAAGSRLTPFQDTTVSVQYQNEPERREFPMWSRSLWDWACDLLKDPRVGPHFVFDAQRLSKFDGESFVRFIDEPYTADDFWNYQTGLPSDGKLLAFILYADKAKLSSFGRAKGYPVVARLANLPTVIRNGERLGGGRVVGWLPIVKDEKSHSGKPAWTNFKAAVWHESFKVILETIATHSKTGCWVTCWDDVTRRLFPRVLILSADYEEQCVMALIRGVKSKFPCPVCLVPREQLSKLAPTSTGQYERRTSNNVIQTLQTARGQQRANEKEAILMNQGLRDVDNSFNILAYMDIFRAFCFDKLHANNEGMFGDHLWVEFKIIVSDMGRAAAVEVEQGFAAMPPWRGLNHFDQVLDLKFNDGSKHEDISKLVIFASHGVLTNESNKTGYLLLRCIRAYLEFDMYISLEVQTTETIAAGREALSTLSVLMNNYIEKTKDISLKNWDFPKNHTRIHVFDDILAKGATHVFNTKPNEKMHGPLKESYQRRTNFKDVATQILRIDHAQLASQWIRYKIEDCNEYMKATAVQDIDEDGDDELEEQFHVRVGSRQKPQTFEHVELEHGTDPAFDRFRIKLNNFLNFSVIGRILLDGKKITLNTRDELVEYRYIKVNYESTVDWCQHTDYLRCSPMFHGVPRYDGVIIKTQNGHIFGRLILIFGCQVTTGNATLVLVQPYDAPVGVRTRKDKHLNLFRVRTRPRVSSEFFSVESIVHGAVLVEDRTQPGDCLVIDTIDTDMFLRIQKMHRDAGHGLLTMQ